MPCLSIVTIINLEAIFLGQYTRFLLCLSIREVKEPIKNFRMTITSLTLITTLNSCGWGATNLAIVRLFTDIYATDHYGFDETGMSCGDFTISDRPESCQKGSDEAQSVVSLYTFYQVRYARSQKLHFIPDDECADKVYIVWLCATNDAICGIDNAKKLTCTRSVHHTLVCSKLQ